ncbi:hypothetical protein V6S67_04960 [Arthrobacter sp. Soc17.1.1.1]|uniref:hypothetical protein n=1 Tax=Arthrobacter sp. Soc17.1.1.1 TaxID=3121277 RepID=UPI002FE43AFD
MFGIADQGLIAVVNLALVVFAAQGGTQSIAAFALVTAVYFGLLTLGRAVLAEPLLALPLGDRGGPYLRIAFSLSIAGGALAMLCTAVALPFEGNYFVIGVVIGVMLGAEFVRIRAYALERPTAALAATTVSVCILFIGGLSDHLYDPNRWQRLLVLWAVAGLVSALVCLALTRKNTPPSLTAKGWYKTKIWKNAKSLLIDAVGIVLIAHVSLYIISHFGVPSDVAAIRALSAILSPLSLVFTGLTLSLTPLLSTKAEQAKSAIRVFWVAILGVSITGGALALSVGQTIIAMVFGLDATPTRLALIIAVLSAVLFALGSPWLAQVRVTGKYASIGWMRFGSSVVLVSALAALSTLQQLPVVFFVMQGLQALVIALTAAVLARQARSRANDFAEVGSDSSASS